MNHRQVDSVQSSLFTSSEEGEKVGYVGGIGLDAVLRQPSFSDEVVKIQFVRCRKLGGELCCFNSASAVWLSGMGWLVTDTVHI